MSENRPKPYLGNPQETIAVLNRYKFAFQKKFGQNFLIDTHVLERIIDEAGITPDDFGKNEQGCNDGKTGGRSQDQLFQEWKCDGDRKVSSGSGAKEQKAGRGGSRFF